MAGRACCTKVSSVRLDLPTSYSGAEIPLQTPPSFLSIHHITPPDNRHTTPSMMRGQGCAMGLLRVSGAMTPNAPCLTWIRPTAACHHHIHLAPSPQQRLIATSPRGPPQIGPLHARLQRDDDATPIDAARHAKVSATNAPSNLLCRRLGTSTRLGSSSNSGDSSSTNTTKSSGNDRSKGEGSAVPGQAGSTGSTSVEEEGPKMGKLRLMVKRYGAVAVVTYLGVYVGTLGVLFAAVESGLNPFDYGMDSNWLVEKATGMLEGYSWSEPVVEVIQKNPHAGNFAAAWILTKFTEPVRMLFTIAIVPRIARALGKAA